MGSLYISRMLEKRHEINILPSESVFRACPPSYNYGLSLAVNIYLPSSYLNLVRFQKSQSVVQCKELVVVYGMSAEMFGCLGSQNSWTVHLDSCWRINNSRLL